MKTNESKMGLAIVMDCNGSERFGGTVDECRAWIAKTAKYPLWKKEGERDGRAEFWLRPVSKLPGWALGATV